MARDVTLRLPDETAARLEATARREGRSLSEIGARSIEEWLRRFPEYELAPGAEVTWAGGQVRGPRSVPIVVA